MILSCTCFTMNLYIHIFQLTAMLLVLRISRYLVGNCNYSTAVFFFSFVFNSILKNIFLLCKHQNANIP